MSLYEYVGSSPAGLRDPWGLGTPLIMFHISQISQKAMDSGDVLPALDIGTNIRNLGRLAHAHWRGGAHIMVSPTYYLVATKVGLAKVAPLLPAAAAGGAIGGLTMANLIMHYKNQAAEVNLKAAGMSQSNVASCWRGRMEKWARRFFKHDVMPLLKVECCNKARLEKCLSTYADYLGTHASKWVFTWWVITGKPHPSGMPSTTEPMIRYLDKRGSLRRLQITLDKCIDDACTGDYWKRKPWPNAQ